MRRSLGFVAIGLVFGVAAFALLHDLGRAPLQEYDEGTYAEVVGESLARHDFLTFTHKSELFFDKPPLYFWLAAAATTVTHDSAVGIRLPAALAALGVVGLVVLIVLEATGNAWAALAAGLLLVLTPPFIQGAREARLDLLVSLFILLAFYSALARGQRVWPWAWLALGVMSKSVIGLFALVPIVIARKFDWRGIALAAAIAGPWHLYEWWQWGGEFWRQYIGTHVLARYETNLFLDPGLQSNYTLHLFTEATLITGFFLLALMLLPLARSHIRARRLLLSSLAAAALMLAVFYSAQTRAFSYLLPVYPLAAVSIALIGEGFIYGSAGLCKGRACPAFRKNGWPGLR